MPLSPFEKLGLLAKGGAALVAEGFNAILHTASYSLVNPVGSDVSLVDELGLPPWGFIQDMTVGALLNFSLGIAAVATPVVLFSASLTNHEQIFGDPKGYFRSGLTKLVTVLLGVLYAFVIVTEFMALYLRVVAASTPSPIVDALAEPTGFWPMLFLSVAVILVNAALGLGTAHVLKSVRAAFKRE